MRATNRTRRFGTYVNGTAAGLQIAATADRNDFFNTATSLTSYGALPRVNVSRPERPIAGSPIYFGVGGEYVTLLRSTENDGVKTNDQGLSRFDVAPTLRVHPSFQTLAGCISTEIEIYRFDLNEDWRSGVRVMRRMRVNP